LPTLVGQFCGGSVDVTALSADPIFISYFMAHEQDVKSKEKVEFIPNTVLINSLLKPHLHDELYV